MISFNPISELNWVYKEFYMGFGMAQNRRKNTYLDFSTYKDNTFIDEAYKKELQALEDIDYMWYKIYCLGEWGSLENLIFKKWSYVKEFPTDLQEVVCGCDFGFTHNSAVVLLGIGKEGIYAKELLYKKKQTTAMLATRMLEVIPDVPYARNVLNRETPVYCDSARPDSIAELRKSGLNVIPAAKGADSVMAGINCIKQHKLFITENSTNIVKELQTYKWKENKEGQVFDEPVKMGDDSLDALRYAAFMTLRKRKELLVCFASMGK
jgi:phage terminase large subunit